MVKMVYASTDADKKLGDGNGKEVKVAPAYWFGQTHVIRYKSLARRKKHKLIATKLSEMPNLGYSMERRYGLWNLCVSCNWDIDEVLEKLKTKKVDTDCSQFYACCVNLTYGKIKFVKNTVTSNILFQASHMSINFKIYNISKSNYLSNVRLSDAHLASGKHVTVICEK